MKKLYMVNESKVPVIADVDILVVGGGMAGLSAADYCSSAGKRVMLVESWTFLGYEITAWQRPWFTWRAKDTSLVKKWFPVEGNDENRAMIPEFPYGGTKDGMTVPLPIGKLKVKLEENLIKARVSIIYASRAVACMDKENIWTVVIANKSGRQAITTRYIIDTTENAIIRRLLNQGGGFVGMGKGQETNDTGKCNIVVCRTLEFTDVREGWESSCFVLESLEVHDSRVKIYQGAFSRDHVYVDIPLVLETSLERNYREDLRVEADTRKKSLKVAVYLISHIPAFEKAQLAMSSLEVMRRESYDPIEDLYRGLELGKGIMEGYSSESLYILNRDELPSEASDKVLNKGSEDASAESFKTSYCSLRYMEESEFRKVHIFSEISIKQPGLSVLAVADVLVAGGGTSGAPAAWTAARKGIKTVLLDMNPMLGGTGTIGGVSVYWCSNRNAFSTEIDKRVVALSKELGYTIDFHVWDRVDKDEKEYTWSRNFCWGIEIKAHVLYELCCESGVDIYLNCGIIGTLMKGNQVSGVVVSTPYGPAAVIGKVTIDATGDGDAAAFAGAEYVYGNLRDRSTMFSSLGYFHKPGKYHGSFFTAADVGDIFDYTRFIINSRLRGRDLHEHGSYLMSRESRHITGRITISLKDQLLLSRFPDTVCIAFSNYDMKGKAFADIVNMGVNPPNLDVEIPYRALIPKALENIIITGKAYSVTHDALAAPRMQKDMQQLGGAAGLAAALSVKLGIQPSEIPVLELQKEMVASKNLDKKVLEYNIQQKEDKNCSSKTELTALVEGLTGDEEFEWLHMYSRAKAQSIPPVVSVYYEDSAAIVPLLKAAYYKASWKPRLLLARMLAWHGCGDGLNDLLDEIGRIFDQEKPLPTRKGDVDFSVIPPEQGLMPEVLFYVNSLARIPDRNLISIYRIIADRIVEADRQYYDKRLCVMDYMDSIVYAAERLAFPEFVSILKRIIELPEMRDRIRVEGVETDVVMERLSYMAMSIYRAMARCGSKEGLAGLVDFLEDNRAMVSKNARDELAAITGYNFGLSKRQWANVLAAWPEHFPPVKWTQTID